MPKDPTSARGGGVGGIIFEDVLGVCVILTTSDPEPIATLLRPGFELQVLRLVTRRPCLFLCDLCFVRPMNAPKE